MNLRRLGFERVVYDFAGGNRCIAVAVLALGVQSALGVEERKGEIGREFGEVFFLPLQFIEQIVFLHFYSPLRLGGREN